MITGCKLNREAVLYLAEKGTGSEILLMIYLSRIANGFGSVRDINYKEVMTELKFSCQTFYNAMKRLKEHHIIQVDKFSRSLSCTINNNIFEDGSFVKGYINTNLKMLLSDDFINSKTNVKRIVLYYLLGYKNSLTGGPYIVSFDKLCSHLGLVKKELLWEYLDYMKRWFTIKEEKGITKSIVFYMNLEYERPSDFSKDMYWRHKINSYCSRYNIACSKKAEDDTIRLIKVYGYKSELTKSFNDLMKVIAVTTSGHGELNPKLINKSIRFHSDNPYASAV